MATVTVLKFPGAEAAADALGAVRDLHRRHLIALHDAAIVSWPVGRKGPTTRQQANLAGKGTLKGMIVGTLFGMARPRGAGIDEDFIEQVRRQVTEGTSALFLMTTGAVIERVAEVMRGVKFDIIATNLTRQQERSLRNALWIK